MKLAGGLLLAVFSACALNYGFFVQHDVVSGLPPLTMRHPLRSLWKLFATPRWLFGYAIGIAGWGLYVVALSLAKLSLVQAAAGGGIGVLAILVYRSRGVRPSPLQAAGVVGAVAGLALLGVSVSGHAPRPSVVSVGAVGAWLAIALTIVTVLTVWGVRTPIGGGALGAASGLLYASGDIATKAAFASTHHIEFVAALLACHGLGFVALQRGFQLGSALQTAGSSTMLTNAVPIAAGVVVFHDGMPTGILGVLRLISFALVLFAAVVLVAGRTDTHLQASLPPPPTPDREPASSPRFERLPAR